MKDIDIAVELLENDNLTLAIVKEGKSIFTSKAKGIIPLYTAIKEQKRELEGASVADRVTGKAAAIICKYGKIKELKTELISDNAIKVLNETNIIYKYDKHTPYIKNSDKTGMCPIETLSLKVNNIDELLIRIDEFFENIKRKQS